MLVLGLRATLEELSDTVLDFNELKVVDRFLDASREMHRMEFTIRLNQQIYPVCLRWGMRR